MAGFDEFLNILKESNKKKISSMNGLNGIIKKINESIETQSEADKQIAEARKAPKTPTKITDKERLSEELKQKKADSNSIIMNNNSSKFDYLNVNDAETLNSKEIFPLNFTSEGIVQGLIFSEILGKPKCKRRRAR